MLSVGHGLDTLALQSDLDLICYRRRDKVERADTESISGRQNDMSNVNFECNDVSITYFLYA